MSHDVSPVTPQSPPGTRTREYYSPFADEAAYTSPRASYATRDTMITRYSGIPDLSERRPDSVEQHSRAPSRASQAPEWVPPEMSGNVESGLIHPVPNAGSSEKMFYVPRGAQECLPEVDERQLATEKGPRRGIKVWLVVVLVLAAALIIAVGVGLGVGLGLRSSRSTLGQKGGVAGGGTPSASSSSSSPATNDVSATSPGGGTVMTRPSGASKPPTSASTTLARATSVASFASPTAVAQAFLNSLIPSVSLGDFNNQKVTLALAQRAGGSATTTVTLPTGTPAPTGGIVTASIFHSSAFEPAEYVSTVTYAMASSGSVEGVGAVDCPQAEAAVYVADNGAVFQKLCYADVFGAPDEGSTLANSLDSCLDQCVQYMGTSGCVGVSYGANISLAMIDQNANCWYKSNPSKIQSGDWQQSVALLIGYSV